jgi:hypothetical protein
LSVSMYLSNLLGTGMVTFPHFNLSNVR